MGIAAGLTNATNITVYELINELVPNPNLINVTNGQIDPIMAVTISDFLGIDLLETMNNKETDFWTIHNAQGTWDDADENYMKIQKPIACSTSYKLQKNTSYATLAMARGGFDGYNIGKNIQYTLSINPNISLSQIIRMYYSQKGT